MFLTTSLIEIKALQQLGSEQATANAAIEAQAAMIEAQVTDTTLSISLAFPFLAMVANCIELALC